MTKSRIYRKKTWKNSEFKLLIDLNFEKSNEGLFKNFKKHEKN